MDSRIERPLVTFYVMAYNQERFVREAVEGALAQTYSPLEVLLSDDCSTDRTFEIMQEAVKGYAGPHTIVLNRSTRNLGVSAHLNTIVDLAHGELLVAADGDDVSLPHRTDRCVEVWLEAGKPAAIASSATGIDAEGNPSEEDAGEWFAEFLPIEGETPTASLLRFAKEGAPRLAELLWRLDQKAGRGVRPTSTDVWHGNDPISLRAWLLHLYRPHSGSARALQGARFEHLQQGQGSPDEHGRQGARRAGSKNRGPASTGSAPQLPARPGSGPSQSVDYASVVRRGQAPCGSRGAGSIRSSKTGGPWGGSRVSGGWRSSSGIAS